MKFVGRKEELKNLEKAYSKDNFQMCVLYGRRRIGKTTLIKEFVKDKEFIYFTAINGSLSRNIELFSEVGKWYGSNPTKKEQTDIDVVGINQSLKKAILGECKFKNSPIDKKVVDDLLDRNGLIDNRYTTLAYLLFSLGGFSDWVKENAETYNLLLITLKDIYKEKDCKN